MSARLGRSVVCAVVATAATPAAASAAWTLPFPVTQPASSVSDVGAGFWRDGTAVLTWRGLPLDTPMDPIPRGAHRSYVAIRRPDGTQVTRLTTRERVTACPYGTRGLVVMRAREERFGAFDRVGVSLSLRDTPLGRLRVLVQGGPRLQISEPQLAVSGAGELAVLWFEQRANGTSRPSPSPVRLRAAIRPPEGRFARPVTLSTQRPLGLARAVPAYGPDGELLVVYTRNSRVRSVRQGRIVARIRCPGGAFGPEQVIENHDRPAQLTAAIARSGRAVVAWDSYRAGPRDESWIVRAAIRSAPRRRFSAPRVLEPGVPSSGSRIALGVAAEDTATVAWNVGAGAEVRVATAPPGKPFGAFASLGPGLAPAVAARHDGAALVAWRTWVGPPDSPARPQRIRAAVRAAHSTRFQPAEDISPLHGVVVQSADVEARAAFDPRSGTATVLWPAAAITGQPAVLVPGTATLNIASRVP